MTQPVTLKKLKLTNSVVPLNKIKSTSKGVSVGSWAPLSQLIALIPGQGKRMEMKEIRIHLTSCIVPL